MDAKNRPTDQEVFDYIVSFIINQGKPSINKGLPRYRGPGDCKCAAGCILPDDWYTPQMDDYSIHGGDVFSWLELVEKFPALQYLGNKKLINYLQIAHDSSIDKVFVRKNSNFVSMFVKKARSIGKKLRLNTDVCEPKKK